MFGSNHKEKNALSSLLSQTIEGMGFVFWGCELAGSNNQTLRIYIDKTNQSSVTVEDCAEVSEQVDLLLQVNERDAEYSTLEVSSPGVERKFFMLDQLKDYIGHPVMVNLSSAIDGRRKISGKIEQLSEDTMTLFENNKSIGIIVSQIKGVRLVENFGRIKER